MNLHSLAPYEKLVQNSTIFNTKVIVLYHYWKKMLKFKFQFWHENHEHKPYYDASWLRLVKDIAFKVENAAFEK